MVCSQPSLHCNVSVLCLGAVPVLHRLTGAVQVMKEGVPRPKVAEPLFRALAGVDSDVGHLEATSPRSEFTFILAILCERRDMLKLNLLGVCLLAATATAAHTHTIGPGTAGTSSKESQV